tara:strand:- start:63 stop:371 length:309 start_codon:yes stop_codon:yes gene_type:complete
MIDTDKYEGHTPAPWKNEGGNIHATNGEHIADTVLDMVIPQDEAYANTQLIADAPLFLVEVKRLSTLLNESNHHLKLMTERFGVDKLVEMIEWDKTRRGLND